MWALSLPSNVPARMLTVEYLRHYLFSTVPVVDAMQVVYPLLQLVTRLVWETLQALALLLLYLGLVVLKLLVLAFPHALRFAKILYEFHATQLTRTELVVEAATLAALLLTLLFRRRIVLFWQRLERSLSAKSQAAARAAPHVMFFSAALLVAVVGRKFILPLTSPAVMPLFTLVVPLLATTRWVVRDRRVSAQEGETDNAREKDDARLSSAAQLLTLWVNLAMYHSLCAAAELVPFSQRLVSLLPYLRELALVVLLWTQLSPVFAKLVFSALIQPAMRLLARYLPTADVSQRADTTPTTAAPQVNVVLTTLRVMRVVSESQARFLQAVLRDSVVSVLALCCVFLPHPLGAAGALAIALLLPAFRSVGATETIDAHTRFLAQSQRERDAPRGRARERDRERERPAPSLSADDALSLSRQWLHYWLCVGVVWLCRAYGAALWPSVTICLAVYLQHTHIQGATHAVNTLCNTLSVMTERNRRVQAERQRERERESERERERDSERQREREVRRVVMATLSESESERDRQTTPSVSEQVSERVVSHTASAASEAARDTERDVETNEDNKIETNVLRRRTSQ